MNYIGGNGQGFFQNLDETTKQWLHEAFQDRPFAINFPGGAEANIATPSVSIKGWGLTEEVINSRFGAGQTDEDGNGLDKWMGKLAQQEDYARSFLYDLQDLKTEFPNLEIVWKSNIVSGGLQENKDAITFVVENCGCKKVVLGNEIYSKGNFNFDFNSFLQKATPLITWIRSKYPQVTIGCPFAPNIYRSDHTTWNTQVKVNSDLFDAVDIHLYLTAEELPDAFNEYPAIKIDYHPEQSYPELESCFESFAEGYNDNTVWDEAITYIRNNFPSKKIWCTEFNVKPSSYFCNTLAGAAFIFNRFMVYGDDFEVLCVHTLLAPDVYGCISRTDDTDYEQNTKNARRTGYYALKLASEAQGGSPLLFSQTGEGTYWIDNIGAYNALFEVYAASGKEITLVSESWLSGEHLYDSVGKVGYISKASPTFNPFFNLTLFSYSSNVKTSSIEVEGFKGFGWVKITAQDKPKPIPTCRKYFWQIWKRPCRKIQLAI